MGASTPVGDPAIIEGEEPGTVEGAGYVISGFGLLVHVGPATAFVVELGGGAILTAEPGGAGYAILGFDFTL